jgi:hypothetical protein
MRKYDKLEVNQVQYDKLKAIQFSNKSFVKEHIIGSRIKLFCRKTMIATIKTNASLNLGVLEQQKFFSFLGQFNKQLYKQFAKNTDLYYLDCGYKGVSRGKNYDKWDELKEGSYVYIVDLSSAYWQIGYKLGYINKKMFLDYLELDDYKQVKRYCISFLARTNKMKYYYNDEVYEILCDTTFLRKVYENIRCELYKIINDCLLTLNEFIEFNIDGVMVKNTEVDNVKAYFNNLGLKYKVSECRKLNDKEYVYGNKVRRFKNR